MRRHRRIWTETGRRRRDEAFHKQVSERIFGELEENVRRQVECRPSASG